jgi:hypothetical protein
MNTDAIILHTESAETYRWLQELHPEAPKAQVGWAHWVAVRVPGLGSDALPVRLRLLGHEVILRWHMRLPRHPIPHLRNPLRRALAKELKRRRRGDGRRACHPGHVGRRRVSRR